MSLHIRNVLHTLHIHLLAALTDPLWCVCHCWFLCSSSAALWCASSHLCWIFFSLVSSRCVYVYTASLKLTPPSPFTPPTLHFLKMFYCPVFHSSFLQPPPSSKANPLPNLLSLLLHSLVPPLTLNARSTPEPPAYYHPPCHFCRG